MGFHPSRAAATCLLALSAAVAQALPVLDQPVVNGDGRASSLYNGGSSGFVVYDRITLAQTTLVDRITWTGAFIDTVDPANNPVAPAAAGWTFQVASDLAGAPGAITDSASAAFGDAAAVLLGMGTLAGQSVAVYEYSITLADPLLVAGGSAQWFTVFSVDAAMRPGFAWFSGSGGDGLSLQLRPGQSTLGPYTDRALQLDGLLLPEPPMALLLGVALLTAALTRRRRPV